MKKIVSAITAVFVFSAFLTANPAFSSAKTTKTKKNKSEKTKTEKPKAEEVKKEEPKKDEPKTVAGNAENGKKLYNDKELKCAACHGEKGEGDGKKGKKLDPKPTDFTKEETWKKSDKTPDLEPEARMRKSITDGGPSVKQSKGMEAYKDLKPADVNDLMEYMKTFKK